MLIPFDQLFKKYNLKPNGVLHLGANTGQEAADYHRQGIRRVIWVEAIPDIFRALQGHLRSYTGQVALCACIHTEDDKEVDFHIASNEGQSSSLLEFGTHSKEHPTVRYTKTVKLRTSRVDSLLKAEGIIVGPRWFLNIDLQGAELMALQSMGKLLYEFDSAYIEVNEKELYKGCPLVGEIDAYLDSFGLKAREVKMTGNGWGDKLYMRLLC